MPNDIHVHDWVCGLSNFTSRGHEDGHPMCAMLLRLYLPRGYRLCEVWRCNWQFSLKKIDTQRYSVEMHSCYPFISALLLLLLLQQHNLPALKLLQIFRCEINWLLRDLGPWCWWTYGDCTVGFKRQHGHFILDSCQQWCRTWIWYACTKLHL